MSFTLFPSPFYSPIATSASPTWDKNNPIFSWLMVFIHAGLYSAIPCNMQSISF